MFKLFCDIKYLLKSLTFNQVINKNKIYLKKPVNQNMQTKKIENDSSNSSDDELMDDQGNEALECQEEYLETLDNFQQERFVFLFDEALEFRKRGV